MILLRALPFLAAFANAVSLSQQTFSCSVPHDRRSDCGYLGVSKDVCERNGCCWSPSEKAGVPWCFHKDSRSCRGYAVQSSQKLKNGIDAQLELENGCRIYGPDVQRLQLSVRFETDTRIHIKITDAQKARWEVPESMFPRPRVQEVDSHSTAYEFTLVERPFAFKITRKSDGEVIFDTSSPGGASFMNPLIFEEQYLELSTRVPINANIFGLGEVVHAFRRDPANTRQTMWARDSPTPKDENVYGIHPFHLEMRNGRAHGAFLLNSNGMDVVLRPGSITYKTIGGVMDFYVFTGPSPADVVHQYYEVIGNPHMIPYWVLGFHHCRYGYRNIHEVKEVVRRYRDAKIPLETMWTDIDYMDQYKDFTLDPHNFPVAEVQKFIADLKQRHQHYVLIIDPAIKVERGYAAYEEGLQKGIFIKNPDGSVAVGKVWPGLTAFPDFTNPATQEYWTKWIREFLKLAPVDGLWIDMNEPASFCDGHCPGLAKRSHEQVVLHSDSEDEDHLDDRSPDFDPRNPAYRINNAGWEAPLATKTVGPETLHFNNTLHYDLHNLYGHTESIMTRQALLDIHPGKRPFILSRSTFPGTGVHAGHWTGDNWSNWEHLYLSIPAMLNFQLFGIPLVGADICGFIGDTTEELCARWMQLGAFYPFSRNHNTINVRSQEPYLWESVTKASRNALHVRYSLLPYYYTLFYQAHQFGATVTRPLFFEFPDDPKTLFLDRQFLIGAAVLITPVLEQGARHVDGYFGPGQWFDWYTHRLAANISSTSSPVREGKWIQQSAPMDHIPVHIRGGHIIPLQVPGMTTAESRKNDFELLVALDSHERASGDLYLDDGESLPVTEHSLSYIHFEVRGDVDDRHGLTATGVFNYVPAGKLNTVFFLGLKNAPKKVYLEDGELEHRTHWSYDALKEELRVHNLKLTLDGAFTITWDY